MIYTFKPLFLTLTIVSLGCVLGYSMRFTIFVAGVYIEIISLYLQAWYFCRNYICRETENIEVDFSITISQKDIDEIKEAFPDLLSNNDGMNDDEHIEIAVIHSKITNALLEKEILLIHGSVIVTNDEAYMITGPSGVGKSYRSKQWITHIPRSYFLNGDKPYIITSNNCIMACGSPWCGKERFSSNKIVPLRTVFFLERAVKTEITRLSFGDAFPLLLKQTYIPFDIPERLLTIKLLKRMETGVDYYRFLSTKDSESVVKAFETAKLSRTL